MIQYYIEGDTCSPIAGVKEVDIEWRWCKDELPEEGDGSWYQTNVGEECHHENGVWYDHDGDIRLVEQWLKPPPLLDCKDL